MKLSVKTVAAVLLANEASAKWNSCKFSDYQTVYKSLA